MKTQLLLIRRRFIGHIFPSHINLTEHVYGWIYLVIGEQFFQKLPDDLKDAVLQAGKEVQRRNYTTHRRSRKKLLPTQKI